MGKVNKTVKAVKTKKKTNMKLALTLIMIATLASTFGQLIWKISTEKSGPTSTWEFVLGLLLSGVSLVFMMLSFRYRQISILQPLMSLGFCLSLLLGYLFLHESISLYKILGVIFIVGGAFLLGREGGKGHG